MNFLKPFIGVCIIALLLISALGALGDNPLISLILLGLTYITYRIFLKSKKSEIKNYNNNSNYRNISPNAGMPNYTQSFYYCNDCDTKSVVKNINPKHTIASCGTCGSSNTSFTGYMCTCLNMNNHMGSCRCGKTHF